MAFRTRALLAGVAAALAAGCGQARKTDLASPFAVVDRCTACHGDASRVVPAGVDPVAPAAPPRNLRGETDPSARGVGAHQRHLAGGVLGGPVACETCHRIPGSLAHPPQIEGKVSLSGAAVSHYGNAARPSWNGVGCAATYCHGNFPGGNASNAPAWTVVDGTQAACGTCHGSAGQTPSALPASPHAALAAGSTNATCNVCHAETVDAAGNVIAGGKHLDGQVQTDAAARHPAGWTTPGDPAFHGPAALQNLTACARCHADQAPARITARTCATCHGDGSVLSCNGCHGSPANAAPPGDASGNTATTFLGVGAHQSHVTAGHGLSAPIDCVACHVKPAGLYDAGHMDGQAQVTGYTGSDPTWQQVGTAPGWSAATATCASAYCHGATLAGGTRTAPVWTQVDGTQATCGSCHGLPPDTGPQLGNIKAHYFHVRSRGLDCVNCHLGYPNGGGVNPATHVNGRREAILPDGTAINGWDCGTCHAWWGI